MKYIIIILICMPLFGQQYLTDCNGDSFPNPDFNPMVMITDTIYWEIVRSDSTAMIGAQYNLEHNWGYSPSWLLNDVYYRNRICPDCLLKQTQKKVIVQHVLTDSSEYEKNVRRFKRIKKHKTETVLEKNQQKR